MSALIEPTNATSRRHVRIMVTNAKLTPLARERIDAAYMPYECRLNVVISYRVSGGNVNEALSRESLSDSLLLTEFLNKRAIDIKDVGQEIQDRDLLKLNNPDWHLNIVGDGLLFDAKRDGDGYANMSEFSDQDEVGTELLAYEDKWTASLLLTVHRTFPNPLLNNITLVNDVTKEEHTLEHSTSDEERPLGRMG
ncbi:hypothetical protein [Vibrio sp. OPT18]|uniref:hypothetical protein n=1 Tax=Vibrio sp. OPT18 TaxID=2778641 RepID=UPI00187DF0D0|nr:hypothetical protein [Vibrio sp. OPT18]MBE8578707.1 hypothetical protein [Vibrio sp. OPT18]